MDTTSESNKLAIQLRENEDGYITGQLDLNETLDATERLWNEVHTITEERKIGANEIMPDSHLMKVQAVLAKRSAKFYKPDSLVFNPLDFSEKLNLYFNQTPSSTSQRDANSSKRAGLFWSKMGNEAKTLLYTVPTYNFIHGTFDPNPVEVIKKKRRMKEKEKIGDLTKPQSMNLSESTDGKDDSVKRAERVLGILQQLLRKHKVVCFYEFVTDPSSFGRTIENLFILSLLVNQNCVRIVQDTNELPSLLLVDEDEKRERNPAASKQSILSMSLEDYKKIVKTFKFKNALIPPQRHFSKP